MKSNALSLSLSLSLYIYIYIYKMCIEHLGQTAPMDGQVLILKILVAIRSLGKDVWFT